MYIYIYILVTMHEDKMQTKRTTTHDARRVEKLFVLLHISMGLSFEACTCATCAGRSKRSKQSRWER